MNPYCKDFLICHFLEFYADVSKILSTSTKMLRCLSYSFWIFPKRHTDSIHSLSNLQLFVLYNMFSDWKEGWNVEIHHIFSGFSATDLQVAILQVLLGEKKVSRECGFLHACVLPTEHQRMFPASASVTQLIKEENMCQHTTKCSKALILSICTVIYLASFH